MARFFAATCCVALAALLLASTPVESARTLNFFFPFISFGKGGSTTSSTAVSSSGKGGFLGISVSGGKGGSLGVNKGAVVSVCL